VHEVDFQVDPAGSVEYKRTVVVPVYVVPLQSAKVAECATCANSGEDSTIVVSVNIIAILITVDADAVVRVDRGPQDWGPQDRGPQDWGPQDWGPQD
jgi:hypothetical protein